MKATEQRKLGVAMQKLSELLAAVQDRTEKQCIGDALDHLIVAANDPPATKIPLPHNITLTIGAMPAPQAWPTAAAKA